MNYQWYPGHMTKAKRMMQENIKLIDLIIELVDARIPMSSRNPDIDELGKGKSRIILLNKSDLADAGLNQEWESFFKEKGYFVQQLNAKTGAGIKNIQALVQESCKEKIERDRKRGIINRRFVPWLWEYRMSASLRLLILLQEKHVPKPEISRVLRRESSGSGLTGIWSC